VTRAEESRARAMELIARDSARRAEKRRRRTQPNPPGLLFHRTTFPTRGRGTVTVWTAELDGVTLGTWSAVGSMLRLAEWRTDMRERAALRTGRTEGVAESTS